MLEHLTKETFLSKVFNYETNKEWKYEGDRPCVIDFYADWCGPCKMVAPILEELAKEYNGKIEIYKVNTEVEQSWQYLGSEVFLPFICSLKVNLRWVREHYQKTLLSVLLMTFSVLRREN